MTATARFRPTSFFGTLLLIVSMAVGVARGNDSPLEKTPAGISSSDWDGIRAAHSASLHAFVPTNDGGWKGRNPGQQWTTEFDGRGFVTKPTGAEWRWGLELRSYGFGETQRVVGGKPEVTVEGQRLSYQWDDAMKEWFVNDSRGLEHGFDVARRPDGAAEGEDLDFVLATRGTLRASVAADAQSVVYENANGAAVVTYAGLKVWDADGKVLPSRFVSGPEGSIILRVEESAARYPLVIDPIAQQAYLKASNTGFADKFGTAVAISGDTVVVGADWEDSNATGVNGNQSDNSIADSGAAYIFVRNAGVWTQQAYLKASNTGEYDGFGAAVAISGDTVIIGATGEKSNATGVNGNQSNDAAVSAGAAYVFTRSGSAWTQQAYLKASNATAGYQFGCDVAISGDTVVVGSVGEGSNATGVNGNPFDYGSVNSGAAYVFTRAGGTWSQQAYLKASNTGAGDAFGTAVSISGDTVVITAEEERSNATGVNGNQSDNSAPDAGAAYVFTRSGSTWSQQAYLKASNAQAGDFFGGSAAISGDTIVIGTGLEGSAATGVNGNQSDNSAVWAGAAYVFNRSGGTWSQQAYLKASNTGGDDRFGDSVAISGDLILVGAFNEDSAATGVNGNQSDNSASSAGAVYLFGRSGGVWTQQDYIKASNTQALDWFGVDVAISGGTAVIGASLEDSAATGIGGNQTDNSLDRSGAAYTFFTAIPLPDINVRGNGTDITDGDTTPSAADHTQFTDTAVGGSSTRVFTIQNTGTADLFFQNVTFSGPQAADFSLVSPAGYPVSPGIPTTFTVQFSPGGTGPRTATVHIASNDPDGENPYSFDVSGTGVVSAPTVTGISPTSGLTTGGTSVTITGTGFTGATGVTFDGVPATSVTVVSATSITCTTPAGAAGTASVIVTTPAGSNAANSLYTYVEPGPGDLDSLNSLVVGASVDAFALQPDGKVILVGEFTSILGVPRNHVARLNADGTLDMGFDPSANNVVHNVAVQADGKVLLGGAFTSLQPNGAASPTTRQYIARVNADGTLDTGFDPRADGIVLGVALQEDGKVLMGGIFTSLQPNGAVSPTTRNRVARVNGDGTLDMGFDPNANFVVYSVVVQADGKVLLGGAFTGLQPNGAASPTTRNRIARVNADGTLDMGFDPNASTEVLTVAVQADGKVLLGGTFISLQPNGSASPTTRHRIARVNSDGTLDNGFDPRANNQIYSIAVQADGKVLLGGTFSNLRPNGAASPTTRNSVARVNADGTLDSGFDPKADSAVHSVALQADGGVLLGGTFTTVGGISRNRFARLVNDPATQTLTPASAAQVTWTRGGSAPEVEHVIFEVSTDGGTNYSPLPGSPERVGGTSDWQLGGLSLPASGHLRARGRTTAGYFNGSSGLIEQVVVFSGLPVPDINVRGFYLTVIADGDTTPSPADLTDLGSVVEPGGSFELPFTIENNGNAALLLSADSITVTGAHASDFTVGGITLPATLDPFSSTTFSLRFDPSAIGLRTATVNISSNDPDIENPYTFAVQGSGRSPGQSELDPLDLSFDRPERGFSAVTQPDGKTLVAGLFNSVLGVPRSNLARINADGTLDQAFNPRPNERVLCMAVQPDGKILIGGFFTALWPGGAPSATPRRFIARLNADGTPDSSFDPSADDPVYALAYQPDGKILLGGEFTTLQPNGAVSPTTRNHMARVNADGTLDAGFDPNVDDLVYSLALQENGKVLLGGAFTSLRPNEAASPTTRNHIARVNADGTLDELFDPNASATVFCLLPQRDGKIVIGGGFSSLQPAGAPSAKARGRVARLHEDGTVDEDFDPNANATIFSLSSQADGKLLLSGFLTSLQPNGAVNATPRRGVARVNSVGSVDSGFDPSVIRDAGSVALQADGKVLLAGSFSWVSGQQRQGFAKLTNDPAVQTLAAASPSRVTWTRSGSAPEVSQVSFELSIDGGATFSPLPNVPTRVGTSSDWELSGLVLPSYGHLRARGRTAGGVYCGSSGMVEQVASFGSLPVPDISVSGNSVTISNGDITPSETDHTQFLDTTLGSNSNRVYTVQNTTVADAGEADLIVGNVTITGTNAADFSVISPTGFPVTFAIPTTFTVRFTPGGIGLRTATVNIASNDPDEDPYIFDIAGTGLNNVPTDISLTATSIPENNAVNAAVGTLSTTDADAGDSHSYALVSGAGDMDNGSFTIDGDLLRLTPVADFETKSSYSVRIQTSDGAATYSEAFIIAITNVNEMPSFTKGANRSHVFGTNTTQTVTNWATSIEDGDSTVTQGLTFNVTNNNNALFTTQPAISGAGTLTYTPNGSAGTATVSVTLSDDATINGNAALTTAVQTFTINVAAAADYTVTTAGSVLTVTDISGNGDTLALSQPSAGDILFTATGRSFSLNGGANTTNSSGSISLSGITSVVVNTGVGADTITLTAFTPPGGFPGLTLHGGTGDDTIIFNGDITFTAGANLNVDLQDDDAASGVDRITVAGNANLLLSGAGGVVFKVSRDVLFSNGSVLEVEDGNILMEANQQTTATPGGFSGLNLSNARVEATGTGSITLRGRTGNSGVYIKGVVIQDGSQVLAKEGGIVVVGNGQSGHTNNGNFGVGIGAGGSTGVVRAVGGNVQITGVGGSGGGATLNLGVGIENASEVSATGPGSVNIQGTAGNVTGTGSQNHGVYVSATGANVRTEDGLLTISGTAGGGAGSSNNIGVFLANGTIGTAGGDLMLIGNGSGAGSGAGVRVAREIQTNGGEIEITGNGGASGGIGVDVDNNLESGGGDVTLQGTGGGGTGGFGVDLQGSLLAAGGSISVTGVAAGAAVSQDGISVTAPMVTSGAGSITIHGTASPAGGGNGVNIGGSGGEVTTGGGSISITGIGGGGGFGTVGYGVVVSNRPISGPGAGQTLVIHGTGGTGAVSFVSGVLISSSDAQVQTAGGNLSVTGVAGGNGTANAQGCDFGNGCLLRAGGDGSVTLVGTGGGSDSAVADGIRINNSLIEVAGGGNITLTGTGGDGTGDGIYFTRNLITDGGDLTLTGTGAALGGLGIRALAAIQAAGNTGSVTLTGTGSVAAGPSQHGVGLSTTVSTVNGPVTITGTAGGQNVTLSSRGIRQSSNSITVGGDHDLTLMADSIMLAGNNTISAAGNDIIILQKTSGTQIALGAADIVTGSPRVLGLTDAELDTFVADEVVIGNANSGTIEVRDVISPLSYQGLRSAKALRFTSTGGFNPLITSAAQFQRILVDGSITLDPGATLAGSVQSGFTPASTDVFPIIQNLGTGATTGTFAGKPQGSPVTLTNLAQPLRITYAGGPDNNDIQLFSASLPTVTGNALTITNGDNTPAAADHTDFGSALIDGGMVSRTFTILNSGSANLNLTGNPRVALSGSPAFAATTQPASATVAADGSQIFIITFDPTVTGAATATVSIANDSPSDNPYTFAIAGTGLASTNADLSSLSLSAGGLSPAFSAATTVYSINVPNTTASTTVTATRAEANATLEVRINGGGFTPLASGVASGSLPLNVGANPIDVRVTAQDGTTVKTYTTTVTRAAPLPILSITDVSRAEGDVGETDFSFEVLLDAPAPPGGVTFDITTANGTASSPDDYLTETLSGRTIPEGAQGFGFVVTIVGDSMPEPNETFFVNVTNIVGAVAGDAQGLGTILNDDLTADLSITKSNGVSSSAPGSPLTYTITASNAGPDPATATVIDTLPAILTGATWTAVGAGGGTVAASGSGNINEAVNLPAGGSVTFTVNATIAPSATTSLQNTASVVIGAGVTDPNGNNNEATDTDTLTPQADLSITKNDGVTSATPGGSVTYTITASNAGPSDVTGATVTDTLPAALTGTWTSVTAGGATATASGSGNINDTVNLPAGGSVTYTVVCSISASATGNLVNTARVSSDVADPNENNNEATDTDALSGEADLSITKSNGVTTAVPGESVTYTITASNAGPSNTTATVADIMPGVLTGTWTAVGAGGGTASASGSGDINDLVTLPAGGSVTYTVTATIDPAATGTLTNTATIAGPLDDPDTDNNEAVDTDTLTPRADLSIVKTNGSISVAPGGVVTYTITASNAGPSDVSGATVVDAVPASLSGVTWAAVGAGGGTGTASGTGNINDTVNLPAGGSVTYTLTGLLDPGAFGILSNTATVTASGGVVDPEGNNDSATDTDTITTVVSITATDAEADENAPDGGTWRVSRNGTAGDLLVNLEVEGASTTSVTDWTATGATFVSTGPNGTGKATIPDGSAFIDIVLTPTDDVAAEADETVALTIAASALYTPGNAVDNEITIAANDFGVTNADDSGEGSLRQAIENANAIAGADTVTFHDLMADVVPDVVLLTTGELVIRESLTISGTGADLLTISGNETSRIFSLLIAGNVTLRGLKLTEGNAIQSDISGAGGAVYCDTTTLLLEAVHVTGNRGDGQAGGLGLYNNSNVTIRDCTIDNNVAEGTSLAAGGILHAGASLNLVNSTVSNNRARNSTSTVAAGGVYVGNSAVIVHSTITGNTAANSQPTGGLFLTSDVELSHNLIAGNTNGDGLSDVTALAATITANHNLVGDSATSGGLVDGSDGNLVGNGGSGALDLISLLDPVLRDNGGPTPTHKLIPGSSAVDGGDPTFDVNSFSPALVDDQRGPGFSRVLKGQLLSSANLVDIGAYELIAAPEFSDADLRIKADGDPIDLAVATGATPPGGTFSGPGVSGGSFHPSGLAPGTYLLTYTYEDEFGAQNSSGFAVTVMATSTVLKVSPPKRFTATQICRTSKMRQVSVRNEGDHAAIDLRTFVTGSGRKDYLVDQPALSRLAPSAVTTFRAGFRPKREGNRRATVTVVSGNAPPVIITLRGKGLIPRNGGIRPPRATDHPN